MKKFTEKAIAATMATVMLLSTASITASAEWIKDTNLAWHWTENGQDAKGWKEIEGEMYLFDDNGQMQTGWNMTKDGKWYYTQAPGSTQTDLIKDATEWYYASAPGSMQTDWINANGFPGLVYKFGALNSVNGYLSQYDTVQLGRTDTWQDTGKQTYYTSVTGDTLLVSDALGDKAEAIVGDNSVAIGGGNVGGDIIASVDENPDSGLETKAGVTYLSNIRGRLKIGTAYANYSNSMLSDNKTIQVNITNDKVKVSDAVKDALFLRNFFFIENVRKVVVKNGKGLFKDEIISDLNIYTTDLNVQARFDSIASIIAKAAGIDLDKNPNATLAELCGHSVDVRVHGTTFVKNLTFRFVNVTPPPTIPPVDETVDEPLDNPN